MTASKKKWWSSMISNPRWACAFLPFSQIQGPSRWGQGNVTPTRQEHQDCASRFLLMAESRRTGSLIFCAWNLYVNNSLKWSFLQETHVYVEWYGLWTKMRLVEVLALYPRASDWWMTCGFMCTAKPQLIQSTKHTCMWHVLLHNISL